MYVISMLMYLFFLHVACPSFKGAQRTLRLQEIEKEAQIGEKLHPQSIAGDTSTGQEHLHRCVT